MKKKLYSLIAVLMGMFMLFPSCQDHEMINGGLDNPEVPEGYVAIKFKASIPDMEEVRVRAVDPDGLYIHKNMTLFCFNVYGLFISMEHATFADDYQAAEQGEFTAVIPQDTYIIHFVANQNPDLFDVKDFVNQTEDEVQSQMEGATGMMIYWGRFVTDGDPATSIVDELKALNQDDENEFGGIKLIRNHAKVSIQAWKTDHFTVTGFVTTNIHAYGTTAPYHSSLGFPTTQSNGNISEWWASTDFVTLPKKTVMMSDITAVDTAPADYIFEHENTLENPVSVIIRGSNAGEQGADKYYRVLLMDNVTKEQLLIRRNHHYILNIGGKLTYGQDTFEEALNAPATNNVWVAVDDWVDEVTDGTYTLSVSQTSAVYQELAQIDDRNRNFTYQISKNSGSLSDNDMATVTWLEGNNVADYDIRHSFNPLTGRGLITIVLKRDMGENQKLSGTLLVKKGALQRTIRVDMIKVQQFTPAWIDAHVNATSTGEPVTLKFTIPETCPESLFPFSVYISTNSLDVRAASGMQLPVLREGEEGYFGDQNPWGYKYEHVVEGPGVQRIYFTNNVVHGDGDMQKVWVEAEFFEKLEKEVIYTTHDRTISVSGLYVYDPTHPDNQGTTVPDGFAEDEAIYYCLVPQKKNAPVIFDLELKNDGTLMNAGENDEFFIYSKSLDYYTGTTGTINGTQVNFDCQFGGVDEEIWDDSPNGRLAVCRPYERGEQANPAKGTGKYSIYMYTNRAVSEDVVRIASNVTGSKAYWNDDAINTDDNVTYKGNTYRSIIFELANYHPFHFEAKVNNVGTDNKGHDSAEEEVVTNVSLPYNVPGQEVVITLELNSFKGADNVIVDPFGTEFDIYIDAPMLELGENSGVNLTASSTVQGRFVYKVAANEQAGTKTLKFKTKEITNAGEIKISSDKDVVVYYDKTFKVSNSPITGSITYNGTNVPADAFVAFASKANGTRVGSLTVTADGQYSLNLRSEYEFTWDEDMEIDYVDGNGNTYECTTTLQNLSTDSTIVLKKEQSGN